MTPRRRALKAADLVPALASYFGCACGTDPIFVLPTTRAPACPACGAFMLPVHPQPSFLVGRA